MIVESADHKIKTGEVKQNIKHRTSKTTCNCKMTNNTKEDLINSKKI